MFRTDCRKSCLLQFGFHFSIEDSSCGVFDGPRNVHHRGPRASPLQSLLAGPNLRETNLEFLLQILPTIPRNWIKPGKFWWRHEVPTSELGSTKPRDCRGGLGIEYDTAEVFCCSKKIGNKFWAAGMRNSIAIWYSLFSIQTETYLLLAVVVFQPGE